MKRLPNENKYQLDIKDQFKNEFEIGQLQGNNFHMTDSADLPMLVELQGNIEQEVIEAIEGELVEDNNIHIVNVDTSYETSIEANGTIEQIVVEEEPGIVVEGETVSFSDGDTTKEVESIIYGNSYQEVIEAEEGTTVTGDSIHVTDVNTAKESSLLPNGGIEQETRKGYNLYNLNNISSNTKNGVTFTVNTKKGSITLNGTCSAAFTINMNMSKKIPIGTVLSLGAFNSKTTSSSMSSIRLNDSINGIQGLAVHFYTVNNKVENYTTLIDVTQVQIRVETNETYTDFEIFPMLRLGATLGDFELYGAMPSLDYPSEVKGVGSEEDINLIDIRNAFVTS